MINKFRIERDFLGEMMIPSDAYYGIQTLRAKENFNISGLRVNKNLMYAITMVKKSAVFANMELGKLDAKIAEAIIKSCDEVLHGKFDDQFILDPMQGGAGTSLNMNINEVLANRALELIGKEKGQYEFISPNSHVNKEQSTNDVIPTAVHIAILKMYPALSDAINKLIKSFEEKAVEYNDVIKIGRTQLQDAVPVSFGQIFTSYVTAPKRASVFLKDTIEALNEVSLGGTAVGTGINSSVEYRQLAIKKLREITGLNLYSATDLIDATKNVDKIGRVSGELTSLALLLSKICNDLRLMDSGPRTGLHEIILPPRQPGSSIMPGKVNPVIPEVINQIAFQVAGNDLTITMVSESGQFELNAMVPIAYFNILQSIEILTNGINTLTELAIKDLKVNRKRCKELVENSLSLATVLVPILGYEKSSYVAKKALDENRSIKDILIEEKIIDSSKIDEILNPEKMINL